jgi:hypothetical protein
MPQMIGDLPTMRQRQLQRNPFPNGFMECPRQTTPVAQLGRKAQLPHTLQNPPKGGFWGAAQGSIRIQEGEPPSDSAFDFPSVFARMANPD